MNSLPTRIFCAMLSVVGAAALVAFSTPAAAVGGGTAAAPALAGCSALASVTDRG